MAKVRKRRLGPLLDEVRSTITFDQPNLSASLRGSRVFVDGKYLVLSETVGIVPQGAIAEYQIEITFDPTYPDIEPMVFEVGNAIPHHMDYHINSNGSCCICIWEIWIATAIDKSVQEYFHGPLKNFFLGQHLKKTTSKWPFGEERHGKQGLIDAFTDLLGCERNENKIRCLLRTLSKDWPRGHWDCPCGSGLIIRKCCAKKLSDLSKNVPSKNACRMLAYLDRITD